MLLEKEADQLYQKFSDSIYSSASLDSKTKELVATACSVMADCLPCIEYHGKKAIEAGATKEEIQEVMGITLTISAGSKRAKYTAVIDGILRN